MLARPALVSYTIKQIDLANQSRLYAGKSSLLNSLLDFQGLARAVSGPDLPEVRLLIGAICRAIADQHVPVSSQNITTMTVKILSSR